MHVQLSILRQIPPSDITKDVIVFHYGQSIWCRLQPLDGESYVIYVLVTTISGCVCAGRLVNLGRFPNRVASQEVRMSGRDPSQGG